MPRLLALLLAFVALPAAGGECYAVHSAAGRVSFELKQAGSPFRGIFRRFGGEFCITQSRVERIDVWLEPASVDSGLPEIDAALKEREFFSVGEHPRITFSSRSVEARGDVQRARGTLQIKGTRREVDIAFRLRETGREPVVSGSLTLDRLQYGIGTGEWSDTRWLGAEVKVDFNATLASAPRPGAK
ncbi:MAG: YceI family protein [Betaproteobacteria bacterium]|nr:YceI family protein [Betaproteobacteria bacterium]